MNGRRLSAPLIVIVAILSVLLIGIVIFVLINKGNDATKDQKFTEVNKKQNVLNENTENEINENSNLENKLQNGINNNNTNTNEILPIGTQPNNNQTSTEDDMEKMLFNTKFMSYFGDITGTQLVELIQLANEVSSGSQPHLISFTSNNLQVIDGILEADVYTISFGYDENGYINTINIDKKM